MKKLLLLVVLLLSLGTNAQTFIMANDTMYSSGYLCPSANPDLSNLINPLTTAPLTIRWKIDASDFPCDWIAATGVLDNAGAYAMSGLWSCTSGTIMNPIQTIPPTGYVKVQMTTSMVTTYGTHWMRVKLDEVGTANTQYATFIITLADSLRPNAGTIVGSSVLCSGTTATLTNSTPGGLWSTTGTHATVSGTGVVTAVSAGTATITYAVTNSCTTAFATKVITVNATPAPTITASGTLLTTPPGLGSYQWYVSTTPIPGQTNNTYNVVTNNTYYVQVTDHGCSANSPIVNVDWVGVENVNQSNITIVHNPTNDHLSIIGVQKNTPYKIFGVDGTTVLAGTTLNNGVINVGQIPAGLYLVELAIDDNERRILRFVKY